jgi:Ca-activated chloride channel family protein
MVAGENAGMTFFWPWLLLFLLLIPLLIGLYLWNLRRKRKAAVRFSSLSLIREALPRHARWRQHLPFVFFLLGMSSLIMALARPAASVEVPLSNDHFGPGRFAQYVRY